MMLLWLIVGIVAVTVAFFVPGNSSEYWPSLDAAGIVAALYLITLIIYTLRKPIPLIRRIVAAVLALVVVGAIVVNWTGMRKTTLWQQGTLIEIMSKIERGVARAQVPDSLLAVLDDFYAQGKARKASLSTIFLQRNPGAKMGANIYRPVDQSDSMFVFVTTLSDSAVGVTVTHSYARGRNPDFVSYMGRRGTLQERFTLTEKGVRHESDN